MKFIFKLLIIFFLLIISFIYGVYIGIVDNNYIHDKKRLLLNGKTIASYYLKRLNYSIDKINIDLSKENERLIQRQIDKAIKNKIINKDSISWVKAKISTNQIKTSGKIKIKGMFLDDFEKEERQFSYSVKMKKPFNALHILIYIIQKKDLSFTSGMETSYLKS